MLENQSIGDKIGATIDAMGESFAVQREKLINELKYFVNSKVNTRSKIQNIEIVDEFEKTASGKIKRYVYNFLSKGEKSKPE